MNGSNLLKVPADATDQELLTLITEAGGFEPGAHVEVRVRHAPACPKLVTGGGCACEPELVLDVTKGLTP